MKFLTVLMLISLSFSVAAKFPQVLETPADKIFVPLGFDSNDSVEIVVTGKFPSPCHIKNYQEVKIYKNLIKISLTSLLTRDPAHPNCGPLKIPFTEVIQIGNLKAGTYKIIVNQDGEFEREASIKITQAKTRGRDDHLYAMVDYIDLGFTGGISGDAILVAHSPSPCLVLDRVEYIFNNKDTLSVLPIMKKITHNCPEKKERLEIPIKFGPLKFESKELLLFVRTIEGRSVSTIISH